MKLKEGFVLRAMAGKYVVIPSGNEIDLNMMLILNDTGKFLWEQLKEEKTEAQLLEAVLAKYETTEQTAESYIAEFVAKLKEYDCLA